MRHDNLLFFFNAFGTLTGFANLAGATHQLLDDAFNHLHHISFTLAQIGIVDGIELLHQIIHLLHQRPLGVAATLTNQGFGYIHQFGILQNQRMHIDKGTHFGGRFRHVVTQLIEFISHTINGRFKARHFFFQLTSGQR